MLKDKNKKLRELYTMLKKSNKPEKKYPNKDLVKTTLRWSCNTQNAPKLKPLKPSDKPTMIQSTPS